VTKMAYSIVTVYGMNDKIGNVSFYDSKQSEYAFNKPYSESTAETIDAEVRNIISKAYERTKKMLTKHRNELEIIAKELLEKEIIFQNDLERLIGKRPFEKQTTYQAFTNGKPAEGAVDAQDEEKAESNVEALKKSVAEEVTKEETTDVVEDAPKK
jgi:AFG3 family protein